MDSCDEKKQKIRETNFFHHLPPELILLILSKLHYTDQVRFGAVCKNWRELMIRCSDFPWLFSYIPDKYLLTCELVDPYSQKVYKLIPPNSINEISPCGDTTVYATKQGWLLLGRQHSLSLYNPFTSKTILLPYPRPINIQAATFTTNPTSPEYCEIIVLWMKPEYYPSRNYDLNISKYCLTTTDVEWSTQHLATSMSDQLLSIEYFKGSIYCLFKKWVLKRYSLVDKSWESLTAKEPQGHTQISNRYKCWLIKKGEDLLLAFAELQSCIERWSIFRFDFSEMRWANINVEKSLTGCAFFLSDRIAFSVPLRDDEIKRNCQLYYFCGRPGDPEVHGYSFFKDKWERISRNYFCWYNRRFLYTEELKIQSIGYCSWVMNPPSSNFCFIEPPNCHRD